MCVGGYVGGLVGVRVGGCKDTHMCFEQHLHVRLDVRAYVCVRVCGCVGVGVTVGVGVGVGVDVAVCMCVYTHIQKRGATPGLLELPFFV